MARESRYTRITREMMDELQARRERTHKPEPSFMTEEVSRRDALARLTRATPGERAEMAKTNREELLAILQGGR